MSLSANLQVLAERGKIDAQDVETLRRDMTPGDKFDLTFTQSVIETLLAVDLVAQTTCGDWVEFLNETVVNYLTKGGSSLCERNADWFLRTISRHGLVDDHERFDLLVHAIENIPGLPQKIILLALVQVLEGIVNEKGPLAHLKSCDRNIISRTDVDLVRRIIVGAGDQNGWSVSRAEMSILFDLNEQTLPHANHPSWQEFFVKALASFVLKDSAPSISRGEIAGPPENANDVHAMIEECIATLRTVGSSSQGKSKTTGPGTLERDHSANWVIDRFKCNQIFEEDGDALMAYVTKVASGAHARIHADR